MSDCSTRAWAVSEKRDCGPGARNRHALCKGCANDRGEKARGIRLCAALGYPALHREKHIISGWSYGDACLWFRPRGVREKR